MKTRKIKILIVEDEIFIKENLNIFLENEGFTLISANDTENAFYELKNSGPFDVGIIDIVLPGLSGEEFIKQANKISPDMKYIIHTGSRDYILPESLKKLGIVEKDVFIKPIVDIDLLIERIKELSL